MKTYEATVEHSFRAAHAVRLEGGRLEEPHEHRWHLSATFRAERLAEPMGVVIDFVAAGDALAAVAAELDGTDLQRHPAFAGKGSPAERVAEYVAGRLLERLAGDLGAAALYRVAVTEAPGCEAAVYPHGP